MKETASCRFFDGPWNSQIKEIESDKDGVFPNSILVREPRFLGPVMKLTDRPIPETIEYFDTVYFRDYDGDYRAEK